MRRLTDEERATVEANLGLARFYAGRRPKDPAIDQEDILQESTIGLMRAVQVHDPERGALSTAARHWCRNAIQRHYQNSAMIRVPVWAQSNHVDRPDHKPIKPMRRVDLGHHDHDMGDPLAWLVAAPVEGELDESQEEAVRLVTLAMSRLGPTDRNLIWRHYALGESARTIAVGLGVDHKIICRRLERARARIRQCLRNEL